MSELTALTQRIANVEITNKEQSGQLREAVEILRDLKLAISGEPALGITGIAATAKSAHRRLDELEKEGIERDKAAKERMDAIEDAATKERWVGRIGSGVVGATIAGIGVWIKGKLGFGN